MTETGQSTIRTTDAGRVRRAATAGAILAVGAILSVGAVTFASATAPAVACLTPQCRPQVLDASAVAVQRDHVRHSIGDFPLGGTALDGRIDLSGPSDVAHQYA